jgi:hypothetical protein
VIPLEANGPEAAGSGATLPRHRPGGWSVRANFPWDPVAQEPDDNGCVRGLESIGLGPLFAYVGRPTGHEVCSGELLCSTWSPVVSGASAASQGLRRKPFAAVPLRRLLGPFPEVVTRRLGRLVSSAKAASGQWARSECQPRPGCGGSMCASHTAGLRSVHGLLEQCAAPRCALHVPVKAPLQRAAVCPPLLLTFPTKIPTSQTSFMKRAPSAPLAVSRR